MSAEKIANAILDGACGGNVGVGHGPRGAIVCNRCVAVAIRAAQVEAAGLRIMLPRIAKSMREQVRPK